MQCAGLVLFLILSVVLISAGPLHSNLKSGVKDEMFKIVPDIIPNGDAQILNGVLFKTVIRYFCFPDLYSNSSSTILYGTNGWTFPEQDVNLTLTYPTANLEVRRDVDEYVISGYQVIIFTDGLESSGRIAEGGLLQKSINLNFSVSRTTILSYEFWLYGAPASHAATWPASYNIYRLC